MSNEAKSATSPAFEIPESNKTSLGLYVMPKAAYTILQEKPEEVHILDVRTFEEYTFVGHL
ncbi:MAG TPA: hypothetical protein VFI27_03910, partial [candidate division Zixibacteria bacterium]|nr:hypothetical protein [candidate division Zixibacteria bacterium]